MVPMALLVEKKVKTVKCMRLCQWCHHKGKVAAILGKAMKSKVNLGPIADGFIV